MRVVKDRKGRDWLLVLWAANADEPTGCVLVQRGEKQAIYRGSDGDVIGTPDEIMVEVRAMYREGLSCLDVA